jgi:hypothetical protein
MSNLYSRPNSLYNLIRIIMAHQTRILELYFEIRDTKVALRGIEVRISNYVDNCRNMFETIGSMSTLIKKEHELRSELLKLKYEFRDIIGNKSTKALCN